MFVGSDEWHKRLSLALVGRGTALCHFFDCTGYPAPPGKSGQGSKQGRSSRGAPTREGMP